MKFKKAILKFSASPFRKAVKRFHESERGDAFVETLIKIIIVIVLAALVLAFLYLMFGKTLLPMIQQKISDMFNYAG